MKCLYWNIRGLANNPSRLALKNLILKEKPDIVLIAEPWMNIEAFPRNWFQRLNFKLFAMNNRDTLLPNLWCFCLSHLNPSILEVDDQHVSFKLNENGKEFAMATVYASTCYLRRRHL